MPSVKAPHNHSKLNDNGVTNNWKIHTWGIVSHEGMVDWFLEWSERDTTQCWVEILATWDSIGFKGCLLQAGEVLEPNWQPTRAEDNSTETYRGSTDWGDYNQ